jgi:hypothetical protein
VSPRAVPRRAHLPLLAPRECEPPAGANHQNWLVGKQTTTSNRNTSGSISILAELSSCLCVFYHPDLLPTTRQLDVRLDRLLCARQIRSVELSILTSTCDTANVRSSSKPFNGNDLSRSIRSTSLTGSCSERKIAAHSGTSKRSSLCKSPNGPVEGLSPEIVESAA